MKRKCLNCGKRPAQRLEPYGWTYCKTCLDKQSKYEVKETIEIVTQDIKESRKQYATDIQQRYKGNTASLEYIKAYGPKGFTREELKNARNVNEGFYKDKTEKYNPKIYEKD